jgi:hypothetical protein
MPRTLPARPVNNSYDQTFDHRIRLYSAVSIAAGVSMLALAQPAEGEVVITRKTIPIPISSFFFPPPEPVFIDVNHDGVNDFSFSLYSFAYHSFFIDLGVRPLEGGAVEGSPSPKGFSYASALMRGAKIGPSAQFSSKGFTEVEVAHGFNASSVYSRKLYGNWGGNPPNRYLGVRFLINGATHYGWVRLTVTTEPRGFSATITAYAYETIPNKRILAGISSTSAPEAQPHADVRRHNSPSLGMLALGSDGLALWRREEIPGSD